MDRKKASHSSSPADPSSAPESRWIKCISTQGNVRGIGLQATALVEQMVRLHGVKGIAAKALGEATMAALTVASFCKQGERVNLNIRGSGFVKQALVDAYPDGKVRGYVIDRPGFVTPFAPPVAGKEGEQGPWGEGLLSVLRTKTGENEKPYIGTVPLVTGHLAKDMTFYWHQSEQIPSAVGLAVSIEGDRVVSAGGFLVQAMPGASPAELAAIDRHIHEIQSLTERLSEDHDPLHLLSQIFQSTSFMVVEERPLVFECNCSWNRVERALALVGPAELQAMLDEDGQASVRCDFCTKEYKADAGTLKRLIAQAKP